MSWIIWLINRWRVPAITASDPKQWISQLLALALFGMMIGFAFLVVELALSGPMQAHPEGRITHWSTRRIGIVVIVASMLAIIPLVAVSLTHLPSFPSSIGDHSPRAVYLTHAFIVGCKDMALLAVVMAIRAGLRSRKVSGRRWRPSHLPSYPPSFFFGLAVVFAVGSVAIPA